MLSLTKVFHFETGHALHEYEGACKNIHGHSYELHVSVTISNQSGDFLPAPGFIIDFKDIKKIVNKSIVDHLDHKLILSKAYLQKHPEFNGLENLIRWEFEPSAENILLFIRNTLFQGFQKDVKLKRLLLFETKSSFVEWNEED